MITKLKRLLEVQSRIHNLIYVLVEDEKRSKALNQLLPSVEKQNQSYIRTIVPGENNNIPNQNTKKLNTVVDTTKQIPMATNNSGRTPEAIKWGKEQDKRIKDSEVKLKKQQMDLLPGSPEVKEKMYIMHRNNRDNEKYINNKILDNSLNNPLKVDDKLRLKISDRKYERQALLNYTEDQKKNHPIKSLFTGGLHPETDNFLNSREKFDQDIKKDKEELESTKSNLNLMYDIDRKNKYEGRDIISRDDLSLAQLPYMKKRPKKV